VLSLRSLGAPLKCPSAHPSGQLLATPKLKPRFGVKDLCFYWLDDVHGLGQVHFLIVWIGLSYLDACMQS